MLKIETLKSEILSAAKIDEGFREEFASCLAQISDAKAAINILSFEISNGLATGKEVETAKAITRRDDLSKKVLELSSIALEMEETAAHAILPAILVCADKAQEELNVNFNLILADIRTWQRAVSEIHADFMPKRRNITGHTFYLKEELPA